MPEKAPDSERRESILEAAAGVFLRYGFRKTSMDDLARAAGLSRQGLYLHFPTKEALFGAALLQVIARSGAAARAAFDREDLPVEERLLEGFAAFHGQMLGDQSAHLDELLEAANSILGPIEQKTDEEFALDLARALRGSGVAARWKPRVSAKELAEHLIAASHGWKHGCASAADYRDKMRVSIRIACG
jgi:AcrR family transcriptional regulator